MTTAPENENPAKVVTGAILVIGDEILSGRTKDKNIGYIADYMTGIGVDIREVRIVPDILEEIISALNAMRARHDHVFTTGGIGPTHDDITADAVAAAFGVELPVDPRALEILQAHYGERIELNEARLRMCRIPVGAELIENPVSKAPGFTMGNVHVMAGVPSIMQGMLDGLAPKLNTGTVMLSKTIDAGTGEGNVASDLKIIETAYDGLTVGSYPYFRDEGFGTQVVLRSRDPEILEKAAAELFRALELNPLSSPRWVST